MIYQYHFGNSRVKRGVYTEYWCERGTSWDPSIQIYSGRVSTKWDGDESEERGIPKDTTEIHLLLLSKQIHYETTEMLYENTTLHLNSEEGVPTLVGKSNFPGIYDSFIRRISFVDDGQHFDIKWFQPWFAALSECLVSTFSSLTDVNLPLTIVGHGWDRDMTEWQALWVEKDEGENNKLRSTLLNTILDELFPKRLPLLSSMHVELNHLFTGDWHLCKALSRELEKEFSEAFERRKREIDIECSNRDNDVDCDDGWVLSMGYKTSVEGGYVDRYDGWRLDIDERVDGFHEFDEWSWGLEETWDAGKDKQVRKAILSTALLRHCY